MFALSPGWKVVNNEFFSWCKDVIMQDDKVERMKEIGRNLVDAVQQIIDEDMQIEGSEHTSLWKGKEGACPHCQGNNFYIYRVQHTVYVSCVVLREHLRSLTEHSNSNMIRLQSIMHMTFFPVNSYMDRISLRMRVV